MRLVPFLAAAAVTLGVLAFKEAGSTSPADDTWNAEVVARLRDEFLQGSAREQGVRPLAGVWGAARETGHEGWTEIVAARADGGLTLLHGMGGALMGAHHHTPVRNATRDFVQVALAQRDSFEPADSLRPPAPGQVRYYLMTTDGVLSCQTSAALLVSGRHELSPLQDSADEVVERVDELLPDMVEERTRRIFELEPE